jgi:hypothetical protein
MSFWSCNVFNPVERHRVNPSIPYGFVSFVKQKICDKRIMLLFDSTRQLSINDALAEIFHPGFPIFLTTLTRKFGHRVLKRRIIRKLQMLCDVKK